MIKIANRDMEILLTKIPIIMEIPMSHATTRQKEAVRQLTLLHRKLKRKHER